MNPTKHPHRRRGSALFALLLLAAPALRADCTVSAGGVAFGSYDVFNPSALDGAGTVSVNCSPAASYSLGLSSGGGSYSQRQLSNLSTTLNYNLYTDASHSVVWGDGTGGTGTVAGNGESNNHVVYGRIPAQQNATAGSYGDTIIVTVTF
jgi:spore coat protein U-like protein